MSHHKIGFMGGFFAPGSLTPLTFGTGRTRPTDLTFHTIGIPERDISLRTLRSLVLTTFEIGENEIAPIDVHSVEWSNRSVPVQNALFLVLIFIKNATRFARARTGQLALHTAHWHGFSSAWLWRSIAELFFINNWILMTLPA